jgi:hypothetical protein
MLSLGIHEVESLNLGPETNYSQPHPSLLPLTPLTLTTLRIIPQPSHLTLNPSPFFGLLNRNLYPYIQEQSSMLLVSTL